MNKVLAEKMAWYLRNQDPIPDRLHSTRVFSVDGRPEWTQDFMRYLFDSESSTIKVMNRLPCSHLGQKDPERCERCGVYGPDGQVLTNSGFYQNQEVRYRHPMRRAMVQLASTENGAFYAGALLLAARAGGSLRPVEDQLGVDDVTAEEMVLRALLRIERMYREEPDLGGFRRARRRNDRHDSAQPSRPGTPDRL
jgi:hypothetical protein